MKILILLSLFISAQIFAMGKNDDPWLTKVMGEIELLEEGEENVAEWEIDTWFGRDLYKFWIKTEGEYVSHDGESEVEQAQIELVYSQAFSAYWDWQLGLRHDPKPEVNNNQRNWLVLGAIGIAPGFWEIDANLYASDDDDVQINIEVEKELMLTQKWVLTPEFDITLNGKTNEDFGEGSGLSEIEASIRIGYEPSKKFQPFIGLSFLQTFGTTKNLKEAEGEDSDNFSLIAGIHFWF